MHPCLNVDEIVRIIARELVALEGKKTAVSLACCRKNFEDPALDALWEMQDQLSLLLKTFPGGVWEENDGKFSFRRIPSQAEWSRFQKYARRIRTLRRGPSTPLPSTNVLLVLQHHSLNTPLLPRLRTFICRETTAMFTPFIPSILSQSITGIEIEFSKALPSSSAILVASMIATLQGVCPNLRQIGLRNLPEDPVVTAAVSEMLLACRQDALEVFNVDCLPTETACKVLYQLPNLRELHSVLGESTLLPPVVLPNLIKMHIKYSCGYEWLRAFRGAELKKLRVIAFQPTSPPVGDILTTFRSVALATSLSATLSALVFHSSHPFNPNYSSLTVFKQLTNLTILSPCRDGCSSTVDDDVVTNIARAMPKLQILRLGFPPCGTNGGVTIGGLVELACHCAELSTLRVHIRVDSLVQAGVDEVTAPHSNGGHVILPRQCALETLEVGHTPISKNSGMKVALALVQLFPRIKNIDNQNNHWSSVEHVIKVWRRLSERVDVLARSSRNMSITV